jgi:hypothetical protein
MQTQTGDADAACATLLPWLEQHAAAFTAAEGASTLIMDDVVQLAADVIAALPLARERAAAAERLERVLQRQHGSPGSIVEAQVKLLLCRGDARGARRLLKAVDPAATSVSATSLSAASAAVLRAACDSARGSPAKVRASPFLLQ